MLRKWRTNLGKKATYKKLAELLYKAGRTDVVDKLCEIVEGVSSSESGEAIPQYVIPPEVPEQKQKSPGKGQKHGKQTQVQSHFQGARKIVTCNADGLAFIKTSPQAFGEIPYQFRVYYDVCVYTDNKILDGRMRVAIDQCAVDFRHMSLQTAALSDSVSSAWCETCILFSNSMSKMGGNTHRILKKICIHAEDLSGTFKSLAGWCRCLAASFHSVKALGESKSEEYAKRVEAAKNEAEKAMYTVTAEEEKERERAKRWFIAVMMNTEKWFNANKKCDEAKRELQKATSVAEKTKVQCMPIIRDTISKKLLFLFFIQVMVEEIRVLLQYLSQMEEMCEAIAAFWQLESDKFASFCPLVENVSDFIDIGLDEAAAQDLLEWLRVRKTELEKYHKVMTAVNAAYNFPTALEPSKFPSIELPTLNVTLQ